MRHKMDKEKIKLMYVDLIEYLRINKLTESVKLLGMDISYVSRVRNIQNKKGKKTIPTEKQIKKMYNKLLKNYKPEENN
jgi:hypothetical protein